jgi:bifunctional lysine-specific demethylase and histidyl-hydroxylase NO66
MTTGIDIAEGLQAAGLRTTPASQDVLDMCVGDAEAFLSDQWGRLPYHYEQASEVTQLFGVEDVDRLVTSSFLRLPTFRLAKAGEDIDPSTYTKSALLAWQRLEDVIDPLKVLAAFQDGATIVLQGLQRYWPPLTRFCRDLEIRLTHPVQCNAYMTPRHAQGLEIHYDTHDVLILQTVGRKRWQIYERVIEHPLVSQRFMPEHYPGIAEGSDPRLDIELVAGQCLYLPAGYLHRAVSTEEVSLHLTVGIMPWKWADVIWEILGDACQDVAFRDPLPIGFAENASELGQRIEERLTLLRRWLDTVDHSELAERMRTRFWATRLPIRTGQFQQVVRSNDLSDESTVEVRDNAIHLQRPAGGSPLVLLLGGARLEMPARLEPVMSALLTRRRCRVGELSDWLDAQSRLVLVRRLVREGVLDVIDG